ncbi:MAG: type II secretion system minor pseudopilin GspJ [Magnetococcales bacterium]|nr:type II secretion system minor pseudopilin GspJ [Magnetococcales bacterium]
MPRVPRVVGERYPSGTPPTSTPPTGSPPICAAGFTLIELIVALAVFAVLSTMAYGGLSALLRVEERVSFQAESLSRLQVAFAFMERDVEQMVGRGIKDEDGLQRSALVGGEGAEWLLELTRQGWPNPRKVRRSGLQRVAYRLEEEKLERHYWWTLDRAPDAAKESALLLEGVKRAEIRFLDGSLNWHEFWPPVEAEEANDLPRGVEVVLEVDGWGEIRRLFRVASGN